MSHITDEILRVLSNQKPPRALTASEIYDAGEFDDIQPVYVAISTMAGKPDGRLLRSTPANGGKYAYEVNPHPRKNGAAVEIAEPDAPRGPQPAKHVVKSDVAAKSIFPSIARFHAERLAEIPPPLIVDAAKIPAIQKPVVEKPLPEADQAFVERVELRAWETPTSDPVDLDMDCLLAALVLRLPGKADKWTKAQRESWLTMFNAAADFLYPESK